MGESIVVVLILAAVLYGAYHIGFKKPDTTPHKPEAVDSDIVEDGPVPERIQEKLDLLASMRTPEFQEKIDKMTKAQIEEVGREAGIELDKRKTKANMIKDFMGHVNHK